MTEQPITRLKHKPVVMAQPDGGLEVICMHYGCDRVAELRYGGAEGPRIIMASLDTLREVADTMAAQRCLALEPAVTE